MYKYFLKAQEHRNTINAPQPLQKIPDIYGSSRSYVLKSAQVKESARYLKILNFTYANLPHVDFSQTKKLTSQAISTLCVLYSVVIIPLLPVHRTIENFSVELSRADAAATALQLYILSLHHAQEILPRKLEYYLPVPCQIRHIDFDACYSLCSSPFAFTSSLVQE
jgi:hypothetical protein